VQDALRGSPKIREGGSLPAPKVDTENKENKPSGPQNTPPPDDGGGGPGDIAKILPIIAAEEKIRENGGPVVKAAGDAASKAKNIIQNAAQTTLSKGDAQHIFRDKVGHFIVDTPTNRKILLDVVNDQKNFLGADQHGTHWFSKIISDGSQIWVAVRNGLLRYGGVNKIPKIFNPTTGLSNPGTS
jgi:hypothetical protein